MRTKDFYQIVTFVFLLSTTNCRTPAPEIRGKTESPTGSDHLPLATTAKQTSRPADWPVEAYGQHFAISTQGRAATQAARAIFAKGGNIIDATIAASFAISVERPHSTGIGGGGFLLFHQATTGKTYAIDFRERAPAAAFEKMFQDAKGEVIDKLSIDGARAAAVPGLVAGLTEIHQKFGHLSWDELLRPAIDLAEKGFAVYPSLHRALVARAAVLRRDPEALRIFFDAAGDPLPEGSILRQTELAKTLKLIAKSGRNAFYRGKIAKDLNQFMLQHHGLITAADLAQYKVHWWEPLRGTFAGYEIYTMPPPSSGGVHVLQVLNILENLNLAKSGYLSLPAIHYGAAALQLAFADRAYYLGDPGFVRVPSQQLITKKYAEARRALIPADRALKTADVHAGEIRESDDTTHFSMIDEQGNAVASTQTVNGWMGAGMVVSGTGIVLNNEMDDFSAKVGSANLFGAIGGGKNSIAPGKTPLSSMSPTLLMKDNKVVLSLGAPGGTRIISCVAQTILNWAELKLPLVESISAVRYHHQWQPDVLTIDPPGPAAPVLRELRGMGYEVKLEDVPCFVMAVESDGQRLHGVADPRDIGSSAAN
ncbi:MAG: gamma-glutamyltransferase [Bdellovibrio sp.]|nr:MAG: gamma-glutamyltransferase [Bdellovibrio sp.]